MHDMGFNPIVHGGSEVELNHGVGGKFTPSLPPQLKSKLQKLLTWNLAHL